MEIMERDLAKVFDYIGCVTQRNYVAEIVNIVQHYGQLTDQGLWSKCMNMMTRRDYEEALKAAYKSGLVVLVTGGNGQVGVTLPQKGQNP